jgi:exopolyphosphatase/guanosine-5'-triphosphate,3'-diphosphate pyrophosphatase
MPGATGRDHARRGAVLDVARRWGWHEVHGRQVARLAVNLFDQTSSLHGLDDGDRELLECGALLHDVGEHVSVDAHHKHTAYLIEHSALPDFSPEEVSVLACLGRFHFRGDLKTSYGPYRAMDPSGRERVAALVALLRVADGLDHTRRAVVESVDLTPGRNAQLRVVVGGDPELVAACAERKAELFEDVFGCQLAIRVSTASDLAAV